MYMTTLLPKLRKEICREKEMGGKGKLYMLFSRVRVILSWNKQMKKVLCQRVSCESTLIKKVCVFFLKKSTGKVGRLHMYLSTQM